MSSTNGVSPLGGRPSDKNVSCFIGPTGPSKSSHKFPGLESGRPIVYGSDMPPATVASPIPLRVVENGWKTNRPRSF